MSPAELAIARIELIVAELEQLDRDSGGGFRQPSDTEAGQIVSQIIRKREQQDNKWELHT